ncbi:sigma-54 dependent transcriptional regulator [bacterium]|jgi:DNA-binding NtrC family response regulator|nr:sigma-54 dependent transcriptional regulator [bacterium]
MNLQAVKQRFGIIGRSESLDRALNVAVRVAPTELTCLINGESGVGKEAFSKIIHELSKRKHNKFIAINTGALPSGTINSELFGHDKGAFTGATSDRKGYFETVDGGTIFLDEIGEMPLDTQAYLLRVLESGEFLRVGSSKVLKTDVRIVAASNVDLMEKIKNGKFREDLYYRLNTVPIHVPSLSERREDIYMLFRRFAIDFAEKYHTDSIQMDEHARLLFENYRWPGNIRELKNAVEQLSVLSENKMITAERLIDLKPNINKRNLPAKLRDTDGSGGGSNFAEREIIFKFLYEMKNDLSDLKSLVYELIRTNDLSVPDLNKIRQLSSTTDKLDHMYKTMDTRTPTVEPRPYFDEKDESRPIILDKHSANQYDESEVVEELLSLESMEKDMIIKALKKYKSRRKDAAKELGISERTLYRKIKQYEIEK